MMNTQRQLLKETTITLEVNGSGDTLEDATSDIFKKITRNVYKEIGLPVIQMETKEVYFDEISKQESKSLLPGRKHSKLDVSARIIVSVKYLDIEKEE